MLLKDTIDYIKRIEKDCDKEINVIRFGELNPSEIYEIVFTPEYLYMDCDNCNGNEPKIGGTD